MTIYNNRPASSPKQLSFTVVESIEALGIDAAYVPQTAGQIVIRSLNQQMLVGGHLAIGGNHQIQKLHRFLQEFKESLVIPLLQKNLLTPPSTVHPTVSDIRIFDL